MVIGLACAGLFPFASLTRAACTNPSPLPSGYAAPCPVFSVSPASISQSGTLTLTATPQAGTDYIYTTAYYAKGSTWLSVTPQGNNAAPSYSTGPANGSLSASILSTLPTGTNYVVLWDWLWDATAQCYKGPGLNQCNTGTWRVQTFTVTTTYVYSQAAYTSGILIDPSRRIDWSNKGVSGGIPTNRTQCGSTVAAYGTSAAPAAPATIDNAITACGANQFVQLGTGTFYLNSGITFGGKSNITLRGSGPDRTFLVFSGAVGCQVGGTDICMGNGINPQPPAHSANWTAGYAKGTTSITVDNTTGLAVGDMLVLDQLNDSDTDNGTLWICSTMDICSSEGDSNVRRTGRSQAQPVVVTGINGTTVSFTPGLYMPNWRASQSPGAWWNSLPTVSGVGVEDMSLDYTNTALANQFSGIAVSTARDWWVKNIRSINANRAAVWVYGATRGTVRDSYFYGTQNAESQSYGIETDIASDILVENNIFQHMAIGQPTGEAVTGGVYGYNYSVDDYYVSGGDTAWMQGSGYHHSSGINFHLFEGNEGAGFTADQIHGTSELMTGFRNYWNGWETRKVQQTNAVYIYSFNRYFNIIGNVLGRSGYHTNYTCQNIGTTDNCTQNADLSIYILGFSGNEGTHYPTLPNDMLVARTLMRWGNYDTVHASTQWNTAEVPSGLSLYANPVPSSQTLPASLYLSAKPVS